MQELPAYWLRHVRLECGFRYEEDRISGTDTELCDLRIEDGVIQAIQPAGVARASGAGGAGEGDGAISSELPADELPEVDARGRLMLPAFREMHIHLDKTYYSGEWKAVKPSSSIFDRIREEEELLPKQLPYVESRAKALLSLILRFGSTHVRTHVNVDPVIGLCNLEATMQALDAFAGRMTHEVVAFPQHGLLRSGVERELREAMRRGATLVGGVDPGTVDGDVERSLQTLMDIAVEADAGIDLHLHDRGEIGLATMHRLADLTEQACWQGRVTVSHAFALTGDPGEAAALADRMAALGMAVTSTVPIGTMQMPLPMLRDRGVAVGLGNDSITDHWSPFGTGDCLEKATRLAELYRFTAERPLARALGFITGGVLPLDEDGRRVWPAVGDAADAVFVAASCSAETVARRPKREAVLARGRLLAGAFG